MTQTSTKAGIAQNPMLSDVDFMEGDDGYFYAIKNLLIRYKIIIEHDPIFGGEYWDYRFEIFKRPYFFGLVGKKKWEMSVQTNGWQEGISFSNYLLGIK